MILFFDTETTGLPKDWNAPVSDLDNWPRVVQLAYILQDLDGNTISEGDYIIRPKGYEIPVIASEIHKITTSRANREGKDLQEVLEQFSTIISKATYLIGHSIDFDLKVIGAEFLRLNKSNVLASKKTICTMKSSTYYCAISGNRGYKWPKLSELHNKLFGHDFEESHNAAVDIGATAKCFWELHTLGVINLSNSVTSKKLEATEDFSELSQRTLKLVQEHCLEHNIQGIPLTAKAFAVARFETKCKQIPKSLSSEEEFFFLKDYWKKGTIELNNKKIDEIKSQFILLIQNEIINEEKFLGWPINGRTPTLEEKITQLKFSGLSHPDNSDSYIHLVSFLYQHYIARYWEILPTEIKPKSFYNITKSVENKGKTEDKYSDISKISNLRYEKYISDYYEEISGSTKNITTNTLYQLILNCSEELEILKSEVGVNDPLYKVASPKIISFTLKYVTDMYSVLKYFNTLDTKTINNIVRNIDLRVGKSENFMGVFSTLINEVDKIDTDHITKMHINDVKSSLSQFDTNILPKPDNGCYIATMVYKDYDHPKVIILRDFRDKHLLTSNLGKLLVKTYYWSSPKLVRCLKNNASANRVIINILDAIIKNLSKNDIH